MGERNEQEVFVNRNDHPVGRSRGYSDRTHRFGGTTSAAPQLGEVRLAGVRSPWTEYQGRVRAPQQHEPRRVEGGYQQEPPHRSEEHTSELQSRQYLVCRLL